MMFEEHAKDLRSFMKKTYQDTCSIGRNTDCLQPNHTTQNQFITIYNNIPCRLSRMLTRRAVFTSNMPQEQIQSDAKLYLDAGTDVQAGDQITITHLQYNVQYECGDIYSYASHRECSLKKVVDV